MLNRKFILAVSIAIPVMIAGCTTLDPYTREEKTSNATKGAAIGAATGVAIGLISGSNSSERKKRALILGGAGALAGTGVGYYMDQQEMKLRQRLEGTIALLHALPEPLERQGLLERDSGNIYLTPEAVVPSDEDPSSQLMENSITYRIAVGPQQGRKVLTLQTLPDCESDNPFASMVGEVAGFSLHAGVASKANERAKLERLCRYITRPAVSAKRLSMTRNGRVRYELKTPWRNGTTHVIFEPLDFISRLAALVPRPRVNLTRFHGIFA